MDEDFCDTLRAQVLVLLFLPFTIDKSWGGNLLLSQVCNLIKLRGVSFCKVEI